MDKRYSYCVSESRCSSYSYITSNSRGVWERFSSKKSGKEMLRMVARDLRVCRQGSGLTQKELADKIGVYEDTVMMYESGEYDMNIETLIKLFDAMGKDFSINLVPEKR